MQPWCFWAGLGADHYCAQLPKSSRAGPVRRWVAIGLRAAGDCLAGGCLGGTGAFAIKRDGHRSLSRWTAR